MAGPILKRSVIIAGHRTSVSLEPEFWTALKDLAHREGKSINDMVTTIDTGRAGNLSSALRVFVLTRLQATLNEAAAADGGASPAPRSPSEPHAD